MLARGGPLPPIFHHVVTFTPLVGLRTRRPPAQEVSASASSSAMAEEEMRYSTAVGALPMLSDPSKWVPA